LREVRDHLAERHATVLRVIRLALQALEQEMGEHTMPPPAPAFTFLRKLFVAGAGNDDRDAVVDDGQALQTLIGRIGFGDRWKCQT